MSLVRFLVYSNQFDIEALVATTSGTFATVPAGRDAPVIDAYGKVQPNLAQARAGISHRRRAGEARGDRAGRLRHGRGRRRPDDARRRSHHSGRGFDRRTAAVGLVWGGTNTLAQALWHVRRHGPRPICERSVASCASTRFPIRTTPGRGCGASSRLCTTSPRRATATTTTWRRGRASPATSSIAMVPGADFTTVTDAWVNAHIRNKGPLGTLYPHPCCIIEGDTPSFLGLINNGLESYMSPTFGGWGGRYVWRQPWLETRPSWTRTRAASRDTVVGTDGKRYTSDQATIWRWRQAFQHDFAARMDWTIKDVAQANHNPDVVVNGQRRQGAAHDRRDRRHVDRARCRQEPRPRREYAAVAVVASIRGRTSRSIRRPRQSRRRPSHRRRPGWTSGRSARCGRADRHSVNAARRAASSVPRA